MILAMAACGGGGGGGSSGNITPDGPGASGKIFLADTSTPAVFASANLNPSSGTLTLNRTISGLGATVTMSSMVYDTANDRLYIANGQSISVINSASTANGNTMPARTITSSAIAGTITSMFLDTARDELYVTDGSSGVFLFTGISAANGAIAPLHTITLQRSGQPIVPTEVFVDTTHHVLYAKSPVTGVVGVAQSITILAAAQTLDGQQIVGQELTFSSGEHVTGITGDGPADKLFAAISNTQAVLVFDGASGLSGAGLQARSINTSPTFLEKIVQIPSTNRLYGFAADLQSLYIINNARAASGAAPLAVLTNSSIGTLSALAVAQ